MIIPQPERLQNVLGPQNRKARLVREAFYEKHKRSCPRAINSLIVTQNSDGTLSLRNPVTGSMYNVSHDGQEYLFDCVGFDPLQ